MAKSDKIVTLNTNAKKIMTLNMLYGKIKKKKIIILNANAKEIIT